MTINELTGEIIGCAIEVHRVLGPGLLESAYQHCLVEELKLKRLKFETQKPVELSYKGRPVDYSYRLDLVVEGRVIVEIKAVERLLPVHEAQTLTYMRLAQCPIGLLMNFNVPRLFEGLKRLIINLESK